jgi:hypothetical protein
MESFTYLPLESSKDEIRILIPTQRIFGPAETTDKEIIVLPDLLLVFELKTVSLQDHPEYTCLSYVWGKGPRNHRVTIDGADFNIGQNLFDALVHLQYSDITPAIWIDSICINQKDISEKTSQVKKMGTVYSKATAVIIWLGPRIKHSDMICGTIQQLPKQLAKKKGIESDDIDDFIQAVADVEPSSDFVQLLSQCMDASEEELETGLSAQTFLVAFVTLFASIEWWRRTWVIQEFLLAKECFFQLGLRRIDSNALSLMYVAAILHEFGPLGTSMFAPKELKKSTISSTEGFIPDYDWHMYLLIYRDKGVKHLGTLMALLMQIYCRPPYQKIQYRIGATDKRDYIYSLYGLLGKEFGKLKIEVDYSKTREAVYTEVTQRLILNGEFDILSLCQGKDLSIPQVVPSWAVEWDARIMYPNTWCKTSKGTGFAPLGHSLFAASGSTSVRGLFKAADGAASISSSSSIILTGWLMDRVIKVGSTYVRTAFSAPDPSTILAERLAIYGRLFRDVEDLCEKARKSNPGLYHPSALRKAPAQLLTWDHEIDTAKDYIQRGSNSIQQRYSRCRWLYRSVEAYNTLTTMQNNPRPKNIHTRIFRKAHIIWQKIKVSIFFTRFQHFSSSMFIQLKIWLRNSPLWLRETPNPLFAIDIGKELDIITFLLSVEGGTPIRPFITSQGYIGIGPGNTQPGDTVCILSGARVPHMLRQRDDSQSGYFFLGDSFVLGMMDGEIVKTKRQTTEFELF